MNTEIVIRAADISDAGELLEIYRPYVEKTAISFEYEVPTVLEFEHRMESIMGKYPYIVAECDGEIIGYAYASGFKERRAYDWAVETSIYVRKGYTGKSCGRKLYDVLEKLLRGQNILNANACIAYTDEPDEYLDDNSVRFHQHLGYQIVGRFHKCGYKFGKWYDMVWMEKMLGDHPEYPKEITEWHRFF